MFYGENSLPSTLVSITKPIMPTDEGKANITKRSLNAKPNICGILLLDNDIIEGNVAETIVAIIY